MEKEQFSIYPLQGYGRLRFGQSVAEAKSFANLYGEITGDGPRFDEKRWLRWGEFLREKSSLTEEEIVEMMQ